MEFVDNFKNIITTKYFCFEGRADRKEFWMFFLANFIVSLILGVIPKVGPILQAVYGLAILLPYLGVTARRLHDTGKSGWLQLIGLVPVLGILVLIYFWAQPGTTADQNA